MSWAPALGARTVAATSAAAKPRERPEKRLNGLRGRRLSRRLEGKRWDLRGDGVNLDCSHRLARTENMTAARCDEATKRRSDEATSMMSVQFHDLSTPKFKCF